MSNRLDKQYQSLLSDIIETGTRKTTRNGETLYETMEEMFPAENDGMATIELQTKDGVILADNSTREE